MSVTEIERIKDQAMQDLGDVVKRLGDGEIARILTEVQGHVHYLANTAISKSSELISRRQAA